jgi:hypothetical protein
MKFQEDRMHDMLKQADELAGSTSSPRTGK